MIQTAHVVTALLEKEGKVLLLRRSRRVGTYRGYWSGISGFLEKPPLAQALREIREETGLSPRQVRLIAWAPALSVRAGRYRWEVYPFLFSLKKSARNIRLDWENLEFRWVDPKEIPRLKTVPGLYRVYRALRRVSLERIEDQTTGGSSPAKIDTKRKKSVSIRYGGTTDSRKV